MTTALQGVSYAAFWLGSPTSCGMDWTFGLGGPPAAQPQADAKSSGVQPVVGGVPSKEPSEVVVDVDAGDGAEDEAGQQLDTAEVVQLFQKLARSSSRHSLEGMLWQAYLNDIVRSSLGLVAAEVWTDVDRGTGVLLEQKAYYVDPAFGELARATSALGKNAIKCAPGVGLAGVLFSTAARRGEPLRLVSMSTIAKDEDLPADERTKELAATFDLVAGARLEPPGKENGDDGILILYARESARQLVASHPANLAFLAAAVATGSQLVAAAEARETLQRAKRHRASAWAKVRQLLKSGFFLDAVRKEADRLESGETTLKAEPRKPSCAAPLRAWLLGYARKFRGVPGSRAPPLKGLRARDAWVTYAWTWIGVFLTLLGLSGLSTLVSEASDGEYFVMLGSFGALMALQFGAPNSPLAQPRNAILGCTVASSMSILTYYLSGPAFLDVLPPAVAFAIAPATAIATTQRLNLLHPPAGAAALIFISAKEKITSLGWFYLVMPLLVGNVFCCIMAMLINNACKERQYPVFW